MTIQIVNKGKPFLFDSEDWSTVAKYKWRVNGRGYVMHHPYNRTTKKVNNPIYLHRLLLGVDGRYNLVDHKNRIPSDNRRVNLRLATNAQNTWNSKIARNNSYGYKGVTTKSSGIGGKNRYIGAQIIVSGKKIYLGLFKTPEEAALAYNKAAIKYFGEFAYQNII